jgi:ATP phosphoribosyltransferase
MSNLRFALPSTGALFDGTNKLLTDCGLGIRRANSRRYTADIPALPGVDVLFQRQSDITIEIDGGSADIGVVGLDRYYESRLERGDTVLLHAGLGFGESKLVIAVPDSWLDVTSMTDLAEIYDSRFRRTGGSPGDGLRRHNCRYHRNRHDSS